jgi:hypothetical protein
VAETTGRILGLAFTITASARAVLDAIERALTPE